MAEKAQKRPLFDPPIVKRAIKDSFKKLEPAVGGSQPSDVCG